MPKQGSGVSAAGLALSAAPLLYRGLSGRRFQTTRADTRHALGGTRGIHLRESVRLERPVADVYRYWRRLENLPRFMVNLESVTQLDDRRSRWRVRGPLDSVIAWDAELINEVPDELLAWRSRPGSLVASAGSVRFQPALGELGTRVTVTMEYDPPFGVVGATISRWLGIDPDQQVEGDLHRLKVLMEGGEAPQVGAQWRGKLSEVPDLESARALLVEEEPVEAAADEKLH